jgi:hypothetical protein|nr:MAG TPA: hypothetical protein [Caudoviricetes sp.]
MKNLGDLRDLVYWMYNKIKSGNLGGSGSGVTTTQLNTALDGKVDKVSGKGLSTNDYTTADKNKISIIPSKLDKGTYTGTAQDLKDAIDSVNSKTIHWNDVQNKPDFDYLPLIGGTVDNMIGINGYLLFNDKIKVLIRPNGDAIAFGNKAFNDLVYGEFKGIKIWGNNSNSKVILAGGDVKDLSDFLLQSWNKKNNKEVIRTQVDEWLRINEFNTHTNGIYLGTSTVRTDGQVQVGEGGAEAILSNLGLLLKKRLRINAWSGGDGADIKTKGKMQIGSSSGIIEFRKILDDLVNWGGNATITIDINDGRITSNVINTSRVNLFGEANNINGWNGGVDLISRQNLLQLGALNSIKFRKINNSWENDLIEMNVNDGTLRVNGIKSNANVSGEYLFTTNGSTMHLPSFIGTCGQISGIWTITSAWYGRHINIVANSTVNLSSMAPNQTVTFRKCYAVGEVIFNTTGKTVVYTSGNKFNGGDGSTAFVSTSSNKMYIDIKNV